MSIKISILAGEILSFLEDVRRGASLNLLKIVLKESSAEIRAGIDRLVDEGLVEFDPQTFYTKLRQNSPVQEYHMQFERPKIFGFAFS